MSPPRTQPLRCLLHAIAASFGLLAAAASAADEPRRLGWLEWSWLEPGHVRLKTKLDTGARTSSLHAEDIEVFEQDGDKWVRFRVPLSDRPEDTNVERDLVLERRVVREILIKEHHMEPVPRYVVEVDLCLGGETRPTEVSLADRSDFNYPLLLGRLGMRGHVIVDPDAKYLAARCPRRKAERAAAGDDAP
ncbi:MAG: ATP-dependent zinc protease [Gammaproteobacteria bacterium]